MLRLCNRFSGVWAPLAILLSSHLFGVAVFGQVPAPPRYPPIEIRGFRAYFVRVAAIESLADQLKGEGKDDTAVRRTIQDDAGLSDQETTLLKQVAQQCNAAYSVHSAAAASVVSGLRQQYPPSSGRPAPPAVTRQLAALEAEGSAIIAGCMQQIAEWMGPARFGYFRGYVALSVARNLKQGAVPPSAKGTSDPK